MLRFIRTRLEQGTQTIAFPGGDVDFPERFRGRPRLECGGCDAGRCPSGRDDSPSLLIRDGIDGRAELDLGACLFAPEEAVGVAGCGVRFSRDHRMATRSAEALRTTTGELQLAKALDERTMRLFGRSLRLRSVVAGSCNGCEGELVALGNVVFDLARFGVEFVASPRHADGIVITGMMNRNMSHALEATYAAVPDPRLVIAVGACAASGGPFRGSPEVMGIPQSIPVDLWIPGCPPHPLTILDGLLRLLGRVKGDGERRD
ncbi:MAG: hydrogenase [Gemmatimonadaceae bacterium]